MAASTKLYFAMQDKNIVNFLHGELIESYDCGIGKEGRLKDFAGIFPVVRFNGYPGLVNQPTFKNQDVHDDSG